MAALLKTNGPILTPVVVKNNWTFLHKMTTDQFTEAAVALQAINLGVLVDINQGKTHRTNYVFVKKQPSEVQMALAANPDLCSIDYYEQRYKKPISKAVTLKARYKIAELNIVPAKLLK